MIVKFWSFQAVDRKDSDSDDEPRFEDFIESALDNFGQRQLDSHHSGEPFGGSPAPVCPQVTMSSGCSWSHKHRYTSSASIGSIESLEECQS